MVQSLEEVYVQTAKLVPDDRPIKLLDLGCCTGLEYDAFTRKNPEIEFTGIQEESYLNEMLKRKAGKRIERLRLIYGDFLTVDLGKCHYDVTMSVMEMHEYDRKSRLMLYQKVFDALTDNGIYIERNYLCHVNSVTESPGNTFSNQISLLLEAGFQRVEKAWSNGQHIILKAMK